MALGCVPENWLRRLMVLAIYWVVSCGGFQAHPPFQKLSSPSALLVASAGVEENMSTEANAGVPPRQLLLHWK
jgi:hypothetical protein